jgi:hypothetical protein
MNDLVQRLTEVQEVEASRPDKSATGLKESIDRDYVHILFKRTGTELGVQLDRQDCNFETADFDNAKGKVRIVGALTLNYDKVRCIADIDLASCEGTGYLEPLVAE